MRTLLSLSIALLASVTAAGCTCGAYNGGGDVVYQRNADTVIVCENGGFVANLTSGIIEGRFTDDGTGGGTAIEGDNGQVAFTLLINPDGTATAASLGAGAFTKAAMNQAELDHADIQCTDLTMRAWWTAQ